MNKGIANKEKSGDWVKNILIFIALFFIGAIVHGLVLRFIFPGYYDPFFPNHEDFYIPVAFAHAPNDYYSFKALLNWTRPVFMIFYKAIGYTGVQGSIACIIAVVIANCALTASLIKSQLKLSFDRYFLLSFLVYCFLLFSMSYFYVFYTEDPGSHLSYFFLILAAHWVFIFSERKVWLSLILASVSTILAFLSKETYELAALFFSALWFLYYRKESIKRALVPITATVIGGIVSVLNNMRVKSVFINPDAESGNPYQINLSPRSVVREMYWYFREGMNFANMILVLFITLLVYQFFKKKGYRSKGVMFLMAGCLAAPFLSWLPNALLPNHHYPGYSFNGLYLFYLPLFLLPFLRIHRAVSLIPLFLMAILIPGSHYFNHKIYKDALHRSVLRTEDTQRNLHYTLVSLTKTIRVGQQAERILIKGITFPFSPFVYPESLREFPDAQNATYDVINYNGKPRYEGRRDLVRYVNEQDTNLAQYSQIWSLNENGKLVYSQRHENTGGNIKSGDSTGVLISLENLSTFQTSGIYAPEASGIAWTDGNVNIELNEAIKNKDTLVAKLSTYLPEANRNMTPKLVLVGADGHEYFATATNRIADNFYYTFRLNGNSIGKIKIISPTLPPVPTDKRILSFPFIELYIR